MAPMHQDLPYRCYIKGCSRKLYAPSRFAYHFDAVHPGITFERSALIAPPETPRKNARTTPRPILKPPKKLKRKIRAIDTTEPAESKADSRGVGTVEIVSPGGTVKKVTLKLKSRALREMAPSPQPPQQHVVEAGPTYNKETVAQDVLRAIGKHPSMAPLNAGELNQVWKKAREEGDCEGLEGLMREGGWEGEE